MLRRILTGERGAHRDVALLNSAVVLMVGGLVESMQEGVGMASQVISESGIFTAAHVSHLQGLGVNAVLVVEALVTAADTVAKVRELAMGEVC